MNVDACLSLEAVGAMVRGRLPEWRGYRGQGRRPAFTENVLRLALFLARHQSRRTSGGFPVSRMALEALVGMGDHAIRSALKCLVEMGILRHETPLARQGRNLGADPAAKPCWYRARLFSFSDDVRALLQRDRAQSRGHDDRQSRQNNTTKVEIKIPHKTDRESLGFPLLAGCRPPVRPERDPNAVAFLRSLFSGTDDEWEASFAATPNRGASRPKW